MGKGLFGFFGVANPAEPVTQPPAMKAEGKGSFLPGIGTGSTPPWLLGSNGGYWTSANSGNPMMIPSPNQGQAGNFEAPVRGPQGQPHPVSDTNEFRRVGNGYPGVLPDQSYDSCINDGPAPSSYRRFWNVRLMDTVPNRVGGGSSGGNDNEIVAWSLAGQLYGRPPGNIVSQPSNNQEQGVNRIPSVFARRVVG